MARATSLSSGYPARSIFAVLACAAVPASAANSVDQVVFFGSAGTHQLATAYYANPVSVAYLFLMADAAKLPTTFVLAGAFLAVIAIDFAAIAVLGILLRRARTSYAWLLVRIFGVLLAALGVDLIISGLEALHILAPQPE